MYSPDCFLLYHYFLIISIINCVILEILHFLMFHGISIIMFHGYLYNIYGINVSRETLSCGYSYFN